MTTVSSFVDVLPLRTSATTANASTAPRLRRVQLGADFIALTIASVTAWIVPIFVPNLEAMAAHSNWVLPAVLMAWLLTLRQFGAYTIRHMRAGATEYKRVITASTVVAGGVGIACYLADYPLARGYYVALFTTGSFLLVGTRFLRRRILQRLHLRGQLLTPVIVAGGTGHVDSVATVLRRERWLGYHVMGAVTRQPARETATGLPVLGSMAEITEVLDTHQATGVIFAEGAFDDPAEFRRMAWDLEQRAVQMIVVPNLADISAQRLDVRPVAGLPLVDVERPQAIEATRWIKRTFDVLSSGMLLILAAPVMAAVALAIWLEDRGPVLFRQVRVGQGGEEFHCLKFRSMVVDAEAKLAELQAANEGAGVLFKMAHDPRITRVGRFIRRFSLDELPQLWNTFRGDMSLVGPRPALPREVAQYDPDTRRRLDVRPGLTGLWQVSGRSNLSWEDTVRLDLYYVDNWSMVQDMMILAKTAKAVLGSDGAY